MARPSPVLVTGMPRSGTTWLARELARAPGAALAGREPMNPKGRQYALGGTLHGWARLDPPTTRQRRALRTAYRGVNPLVYSRYGHRQWRAPLPTSRLVVKDPFAMLSTRAVADVTGARVVLVFRHPAAGLASYRRMGWRPDIAELQDLVAGSGLRDDVRSRLATTLTGPHRDDVDEMAAFWGVLHAIALDDLAAVPGSLVVAHEDVAAADDGVRRALFTALGMRVPPREASRGDAGPKPADPTRLHNLDRRPEVAASSWRAQVSPDEVARIESVTDPTWAALMAARLRPASG